MILKGSFQNHESENREDLLFWRHESAIPATAGLLVFVICCSDGHKVAVRLNKQVKKASGAIRKRVTAYNSVTGFSSSTGATLPGTVSEIDVLPSSSIFATVLDISQVALLLWIAFLC